MGSLDTIEILTRECGQNQTWFHTNIRYNRFKYWQFNTTRVTCLLGAPKRQFSGFWSAAKARRFRMCLPEPLVTFPWDIPGGCHPLGYIPQAHPLRSVGPIRPIGPTGALLLPLATLFTCRDSCIESEHIPRHACLVHHVKR